MSYKILGDSCCDYDDFDGRLDWLGRIPLTIELGDKRYRDDENLNCYKLLREMAASSSAPRSACPSIGDFAEAFACGAEEIYVVTLSEKVSGTYTAAKIAADIFTEQNPEVKIHVFDSMSAAAGEIAICLKIRELKESGVDFDETVAMTEVFIESMTTMFVLETLDVFRKNGRLNHLQALVTGALKIKMVMGADKGAICALDKALTTQRALGKLVDRIKEKYSRDVSILKRTLVITECNCRQRAEKLRDDILINCPFKKTIICRAGGLSTMYANSGGIIVAF